MRCSASALVVLFALPLGAACQAAPKTNMPTAAAGDSVAMHIAATESCLLPPVRVTGKPPECRTLAGEMAKFHVPAVSVAVIHHGELEWARGYGVQREGGPAVGTSTLFQAASISKSLTAMAALKLVSENKITLDAPIQAVLMGWKLPESPLAATQPVTLRELLSHTAGVSVHGFAGYAAGEPVPTLAQVLNGEKPANSRPVVVEATPGTKWQYSGGGYEIVQQALMDVTGKPFAEIMKTLVLDPLGMTESTYQQPLDPARMAQVAVPNERNGMPIAGGPHTYPEQAAAGLWTTPTDLAKWVIEMQRSMGGHANHVLSHISTRIMLTPVKNDYGLGVELHDTGGMFSFSHSGSNAGYLAYYIGYANGDGAVMMTNSEAGGNVIAELQRSLAKTYGWPDFAQIERTAVKVPLAGELQYVGKFQAKATIPFSITRQGDHLEFADPSGVPQPLLNESATTFFLTAGTLRLVFETPDGGTLYFGEKGEQTVPFVRLK